jgi:hypothetical protein
VRKGRYRVSREVWIRRGGCAVFASSSNVDEVERKGGEGHPTGSAEKPNQ